MAKTILSNVSDFEAAASRLDHIKGHLEGTLEECKRLNVWPAERWVTAINKKIDAVEKSVDTALRMTENADSGSHRAKVRRVKDKGQKLAEMAKDLGWTPEQVAEFVKEQMGADEEEESDAEDFVEEDED